MIGPVPALRRAARSLGRHKPRTIALAGGVAVGVGMLVFMLSFVAGTRRALLDRVVSSPPIPHLTVVPRSYSLSVLRFESPFADLDVEAAERIASLDGVERVMPMAGLRLPAQLRGNFFGQGFVTDTGVFGIDRELVADQLAEGEGFVAKEGDQGPYPAVISTELIDMYNTGFAKTNDLPQLTPQVLSGQEATVYLGYSSFRREEPLKTVRVKMVGVSDRVPLVGISIPRPLVEVWNEELAGEEKAEYVQLTVVAARAEEVDQISEQIESLGFSVTSDREVARRIRSLTRILEAAFALIGLVVLGVAGLGIANALLVAVMERRHEIGVFRSVGATRGDIRILFLAEAFLVGGLGAVAGVVMAAVGIWVADRALDRVLPELPFLPDSFFALSWPIVVTGLSLGAFVSIFSAVSPAHRAARLDPARVLKAG
jgi:ABC-type lipoprotein release transport system permease subunit